MTQADDDHYLIARIARKDTQAYRQLVTKHLPYCIRFAERMTGNRQDAEDIAQDVCFKIWQEAPNWKPDKAQFSTWLYRVLYNRCIDYKRKVVQFTPVDLEAYPDSTFNAEDGVMYKQRAEQVRIALDSLHKTQRAAIILSYYEGIQGKEAAEIIGVNYDYFYHLLSNARKVLRRSLLEGDKEKKSER